LWQFKCALLASRKSRLAIKRVVRGL